jgi:hypothetical protein
LDGIEMRKYYWAGFVDGKVDEIRGQDQYSAEFRWYPALFRTKSEAMLQYSDVRKVEIKEVKKV